MKTTSKFLLFALISSTLSIHSMAGTIVCDGVLGNSGEQGNSLVKYEGGTTSGIGVVCDRYGTLWDRGGTALNRYAVDGRLLASYRLPKVNADRNSDAIALSGDTLILRLGKSLYSLSIDAPAGTEVKDMKIDAEKMSLSSKDGWVIASKGPDVFLVNATGEKKPVVTLEKNPENLEFGSDGAVCVTQGWKVYKVIPGGANKLELVAGAPGERPICIDGNWYGSAWHSTLRKFDGKLQPAPGVVLGGNSGSFIGHVAEQSEVVNGRGLAKINDNLFAISGLFGVIHLLEWKGEDKRFEPVRRIGALRDCNAIGLDRDGHVWCVSGNWDWSDGPSTPQHWGVPAPEKVFGITTMDSGSLCGYGIMWGKPMVMFGKMDKEIRLGRIEQQTSLPKEAVAVAVSELNKKRVLLILDAKGKVSAANINADGSYNSDGGDVQLTTAEPVKAWTSLASPSNDMLVCAGDGFVIEFARDGSGWKEKRRWNSFGQDAADKFGPQIWLAEDSGRLWVSDSKRNRVLCFDQASGKLIASYGTADSAGTEISKLDAPEVIAASGNRATVYDSGNQRILKLEIQEK